MATKKGTFRMSCFIPFLPALSRVLSSPLVPARPSSSTEPGNLIDADRCVHVDPTATYLLSPEAHGVRYMQSSSPESRVRPPSPADPLDLEPLLQTQRRLYRMSLVRQAVRPASRHRAGNRPPPGRATLSPRRVGKAEALRPRPTLLAHAPPTPAGKKAGKRGLRRGKASRPPLALTDMPRKRTSAGRRPSDLCRTHRGVPPARGRP